MEETNILPFEGSANAEPSASAPAAPVVYPWSGSADLGPRQEAAFNRALRGMAFNARSTRDLFGVLEDESSWKKSDCVMVPMVGRTHPDYTARLAAIQARHGVEVTPANYRAIIADLEADARWYTENAMICDRRESRAKIEAREAARAKIEAEAEARREAQRISEDTEMEAVKIRFPWAVQVGSDHSRAAANAKTLLASAHPGIRFSVRSESYSGGSAIRVSWEAGPRESTIRALLDAFDYSTFDAMTDCRGIKDNGRGFRKWMGSVSHVGVSRSVAKARAAIRAELPKVLDLSGMDDIEIDTRCHRIICDHDIPAGAEVTGCRWDAEKSEIVPAWTVPEVPPVPEVEGQAEAHPGARVTFNAEKGVVEVRFPAKPHQTVLDGLKGAGFRWSRFSSCWWASRTERTVTAAYASIGATPPADVLAKARGADLQAADHAMEVAQGIA